MAALVQSKDSGDAGATTLVFDSNVTAGNLGILITRTSSGSNPPTSITDNRSSTWAQVGSDVLCGTNNLRVWWAKFGTSGACTLTLNGGTGSTERRYAEEVSGITDPSVDQVNQPGGTGTASSSANAGSINPTAVGWAFCAVNFSSYPSVSPTAGSGWTRRINSGVRHNAESRELTGLSSITGDWALPESNTWNALVVNFKAAAAVTAHIPAYLSMLRANQ